MRRRATFFVKAFLRPEAAGARRVAAFSLAELVVVLALLAVLGALAAPRYAGALANYRAAAAAQRVAADLSLARSAARTTSRARTLSFDLAAGSYSISNLPDLDHPAQGYTVVLSAEPYRAALRSAAFGGGARVSFDRFGTPGSGGSVVVQVGTTTKTVVLDAATGRASVQ